MVDIFSPEQRHYVMSRIRGKDTKPELLVRRWLWHHGYRYRLNVKSVPGKPDIVLRKYHTAIFVNGCFWHGHQLAWDYLEENGKWKTERCPDGVKGISRRDNISVARGNTPGEMDDEIIILEDSKCCKIPKTNREFWIAKLRRNHERDEANYQLLKENGWLVLVVWECELKKDQLESTMTRVELLMNDYFLALHQKHSNLAASSRRKRFPEKLRHHDEASYSGNERYQDSGNERYQDSGNERYQKKVDYEQEEGTTAAIAAESH